MEIIYLPNVIRFLKVVDKRTGIKVQLAVKSLGEFGQLLRFPDSRMVARGLFELRIMGATNVRLLYFFHANTAVIVHGVIKKQNKLHRRDIAYALDIRRHFMNT